MNARFRSWRIACTLLASAIVMMALAAGVRADDAPRAGLVLVYGPDDVQTLCIRLDVPEITGMELLERAGLPVIQESTAGVGSTVCKIDAVGCDFPGEHCFCQCLGTPCSFWSYWYWQDGDWVFAQRGATTRRVRDGAIEAWVWGDGQTSPPIIDPAAICAGAPSLSAALNQDDYPGPEPIPTFDPYPGPDDEEPEEPTPEPEEPELEPTADELPPPTVVPRERTPEPEDVEEPTTETSEEPTLGPTEPGVATPEATATERPSPTPTLRATATPDQTATPTPPLGPSATPTDDGMAAAIATAVTRNRATPPVVSGGTSAGGYVAFALLALVLVGLIVYAVLLQRQRARQAAE